MMWNRFVFVDKAAGNIILASLWTQIMQVWFINPTFFTAFLHIRPGYYDVHRLVCRLMLYIKLHTLTV